MPTSWSLHSFDYSRFVKGAFDPHIGATKLRNFQSGPESDCPDRKALTKEVLEILGKGHYDYGSLAKKHWKYLDAYIRVYVRDVMESEPLVQPATSVEKWQKLLRFYLDRNGKDATIFTALAGVGRRHNPPAEKKNWITGLANLIYGKPENYLILAGEELETFCRHLQVLFYVNPWDWPTYLPAQELLKPLLLEPFLKARDNGLAVLVVGSETVKAAKPIGKGSIAKQAKAKAKPQLAAVS
ncbi:hypothetical protein CLV84_0055 [Neolewinella xylanilytica]|uniref:Uncharacterized protein n=1 Tax=Neolewinella xylanilytica TaxID=1514080 RepID=A0A2S6I6K2_9BACT|nr:hypothetical protein [Neolewinella xylanilytica]PPK87121.1 hypothetical protein CLV84_0055 [Neolewinella xylanilytica]